jgi:xanthine dehydrogenase accessory factor
LAIPRDEYARICAFDDLGTPVILVRVERADGSAPREAGAMMAVTAESIVGTIGGGQLEWTAIAHARTIAAQGMMEGRLDIALGPAIGQCCGGRVELRFERLNRTIRTALGAESAAAERQLRHVLVFGAGHTGKALARALDPLPFQAFLVDQRPEALDGLDGTTTRLCVAMPETLVREAPAGSAFVAMTHMHSLDFLITAEALARRDAAYCGMIGSATKRAVFRNWLEEHGYPRDVEASLVCPIGGSTVRDKRPEIIAALTVAEILTALHACGSAEIA